MPTAVKIPTTLDPRDHDAVAAFVLDSMPDVHGAVEVSLKAKTCTLAVSELTDDLTSRGASVLPALPRVAGDFWKISVTGVDAGRVPEAMWPAAHLRRILISEGISRSAYGHRCWPELSMGKKRLKTMSKRGTPDEQARATAELEVRGTRKRVDAADRTMRDRIRHTLAGHWPPAAKIEALARGVGCEIAEFYDPISYPILWSFSTKKGSHVGYVVYWDEDADGDCYYTWRLADGSTIEGYGAPDDLALWSV